MGMRSRINDVDLEYDDRGDGEPVLFIHGALLADAFAPLLAQPALADRYRLVSYHRRGYAGSSPHTGPCSIAQQAADALSLLDHLGIQRAHLVGHSYGGAIAMHAALDAPARVASLALLESAGVPTPSWDLFVTGVALPALARYEANDTAGAVESFLLGVCGPATRAVVDEVLPAGAFALAQADGSTFFGTELPALADWGFGPEQASRIRQPVLLVLGAESDEVIPVWSDVHGMLQQWFPHAEHVVLPGATHALQMMNPDGMADLLAAFLARRPIEAPMQSR